MLQLSRYIHRNPIETQSPLVEDLAQSPWSSYPACIGQAKAEPWLECEYTYAVLGHRYKFKQYQRFVLGGNDEELMTFYSKGNTASVLGCPSFKAWVQTQYFTEVTRAAVIQQLQPELDITAIIAAVAAFYDCPISQLTEVNKGPTKGFEGRKVAMYFCQELLAANLRDIAKHFQLGHGGSVSFITHQIRQRQKSDKVFAQFLGEIFTFIMKQAA
ncbi:hypothetical protein PA25_05280 [Pseudoalteromonas sp. A25]|uniref:hypothetical protein n=1 Tax=Pseudoalteromonas sp. A25 TaxID=116092 RepID=UPI0012A09511|nr:hypothetical protein [Pseudoalteromonas sp. A25]BBN80543.1 hypothetical protein PA25_05280 [Pseudoalteromonas sp. A25]